MHSAAFQCFSAVSLSQFRFHIFHSTENEDNLPFAHAGLQRWLARLKVDSSLHPADMSEQRSRIAPHLLMTTPNKRPIQKWAVGFFQKRFWCVLSIFVLRRLYHSPGSVQLWRISSSRALDVMVFCCLP